jgi:hypothetical protein
MERRRDAAAPCPRTEAVRTIATPRTRRRLSARRLSAHSMSSPFSGLGALLVLAAFALVFALQASAQLPINCPVANGTYDPSRDYFPSKVTPRGYSFGWDGLVALEWSLAICWFSVRGTDGGAGRVIGHRMSKEANDTFFSMFESTVPGIFGRFRAWILTASRGPQPTISSPDPLPSCLRLSFLWSPTPLPSPRLLVPRRQESHNTSQ